MATATKMAVGTINTSPSVPATLLYSKSSKQILLLEAGKELVDLILGFLTLPMGCVVKLLAELEPMEKVASSAHKMGDSGLGEYKASHLQPQKTLVGINNLFESVEKLEESRMCTGKMTLIDPKPAIPWGGKLLALPGGGGAGGSGFYCCASSGSCDYISSKPNQICPKHKKKLDTLCKLVNEGDSGAQSQVLQSPKPKQSLEELSERSKTAAKNVRGSQGGSKEGNSYLEGNFQSSGFVKPENTFMITNSLEVFPSSTINSIVRLASLKSERLGDLETIEIYVGSEEILQLLKASLSSANILNDVFPKYCKKAAAL